MRYLILGLILFASQAYADNILIVGDSISDGYTPFVQLDMPCVVHAFGRVTPRGDNDGSSLYIKNHLAEIMAGGPYKIIYFNAGVHDIWEHRPIANYQQNLTEIVEAFKATGAVIIFATTTPYPYPHIALNSEVDAYNAAALWVMRNHGVSVDNLHGWVQGEDALHIPGNYHWTEAGYQYIAGGVERSLNLYGGC